MLRSQMRRMAQDGLGDVRFWPERNFSLSKESKIAASRPGRLLSLVAHERCQR
jgi:hypothetical protein